MKLKVHALALKTVLGTGVQLRLAFPENKICGRLFGGLSMEAICRLITPRAQFLADILLS